MPDYTLTLDATSGAQANGQDTNTATVKLTDGETLISGEAIIFTLSGNTARFTDSNSQQTTLTTGALGGAVATFTNTREETVIVTATWTNRGITQSVTSSFGSGSAGQFTLELNAENGAQPDGQDTNSVTGTLTNSMGTPVARAIIDIAITGQARFDDGSQNRSLVTLTDGTIHTTLTDIVAEKVTITAVYTTGNVTASTTSTFGQAESDYLLELHATKGAAPDGKEANTVTATLSHKDSGAPVSRAIIDLSIDGSAQFTDTTSQATSLVSGADGKVTTRITDTVDEKVLLKGQYLDGGASATANSAFGDSTHDYRMTLDITSDAPADGNTPNTLTVLLTDSAGNPVSHQIIDLIVYSGSAIFTDTCTTKSAIVTYLDGKGHMTLTDTVAEGVTVMAILTVPGDIIQKTGTSTFGGGGSQGYALKVEADDGAKANGQATNGVRATLTDPQNQPVKEAILTMGVSGSALFPNGSDQEKLVTEADGSVATTLTNTVAEKVTVTVRYAEGSAQGSTLSTFAPDGSGSTYTLVVDVDSGASANGQETNGVCAMLTDPQGKPVGNAILSLMVDGSAHFPNGNRQEKLVTETDGTLATVLTDTTEEKVTVTAIYADGPALGTAVSQFGSNATTRLLVMGARSGAAYPGMGNGPLVALEALGGAPVIAHWRYDDYHDEEDSLLFSDPSPEKSLEVRTEGQEEYVVIRSCNLVGNGDVSGIPTANAYTALLDEGRLVAWGDANSSASRLPDDIAVRRDVQAVYGTLKAFAALCKDGSVVAWGDKSHGGNANSVSSLRDIISATQNYGAFAALRKDGSVVAWGGKHYGGDANSVADLHDIVNVTGAGVAFSALRKDGSVVAWGNKNYGGDASSVSNLRDIISITGNTAAFAALRRDGSVVAWGDKDYGGDNSAVADLHDIINVTGASYAFSALRKDGSVVAWGDKNYGGDASSVSNLRDIISITGNQNSFAALRKDGSVAAWGRKDSGGDASSVSNLRDIINVTGNTSAFAALRRDGSVVAWGNKNYGGDASSVSSLRNIRAVYPIPDGFIALTEEGRLATWGGITVDTPPEVQGKIHYQK